MVVVVKQLDLEAHSFLCLVVHLLSTVLVPFVCNDAGLAAVARGLVVRSAPSFAVVKLIARNVIAKYEQKTT